jgi:HEAT repeat protein
MRAVYASLFAAACVLGLTACPPAQERITGTINGARSLTYEKAMTTLLVYARDNDATIRANCVEALENSDDPRARGAIEQGLNDKEPVVRFASAMAAGKRKDALLKPRIAEMCRSDLNTNVRIAAIYAWYRMGDIPDDTLNYLIKTIGSENESVRANTYMVLGLMGNKGYIRLVASRIGLENGTRARFEMQAALARLGDRRGIDPIIVYVWNKVADMEWNALVVCPDIPGDDRVYNALLSCLKNKLPLEGNLRNLEIRRQLLAARSLAKMNKTNGLQFALDQIKDPAPDVRVLVAFTLGDALNLNGEPRLEPLLDDKEPSVRIAASAAIVNIWARMAQAPQEPAPVPN